jgi:hypothetical protein
VPNFNIKNEKLKFLLVQSRNFCLNGTFSIKSYFLNFKDTDIADVMTCHIGFEFIKDGQFGQIVCRGHRKKMDPSFQKFAGAPIRTHGAKSDRPYRGTLL